MHAFRINAKIVMMKKAAGIKNKPWVAVASRNRCRSALTWGSGPLGFRPALSR